MTEHPRATVFERTGSFGGLSEHAPIPCVCSACGEEFPSKGARRRHAVQCYGDDWDRICASLDRHARGGIQRNPELWAAMELDWHRGGASTIHITPEVRARAAAEWAAMDERGRLPEGWTYETNPLAGGE